jgi:hypoxanthine phosphoribosyltransferase
MAIPSDVHERTGGQDIRRIVYSQETSRAGSRRWGARSRRTIPGEDLLVVGLLKGSFIFLADLAREIARPLHVDFLVASSYGSGTVSTGEVRLVYDPEASCGTATCCWSRTSSTAATRSTG